jgi:hypothetical protein
MKPKPTANGAKPVNTWEQISHLYDGLIYWLYERQNAHRARSYADRLEQALARNQTEAGAIFAEECRSLIYEAKGDWKQAIKHREKEIGLIRRLHARARNTLNERYVFRQYSYADLRDRFELLAMLYRDSDDMDKAVATLQRAKQFCKKHGVKFTAETILREYQEDKQISQHGKSRA